MAEAKQTTKATIDQINGFRAANYRDDTDFVIQKGKLRWHVHKLVLSKASRFFLTACNGPFKECEDGVLKLQDHASSTVARLIQWLYLDDFDTPINNPSRDRGFPTIEEMTKEPDLFAKSAHPDSIETQTLLVTVYLNMSSLAEQYVIDELHMKMVRNLVKILSGLNRTLATHINLFAQKYIACHKASQKCIERDSDLKKEMAEMVAGFKLAGYLPDAFESRLEAEILKDDAEFVIMICKSMQIAAKRSIAWPYGLLPKVSAKRKKI